MSIGLLIGLIGTSLGGLLGVVFSINISSIQNLLEKLFKTDLFAKEIYYLSSLPSQLDHLEVLYVVIISLIISLNIKIISGSLLYLQIILTGALVFIRFIISLNF